LIHHAWHFRMGPILKGTLRRVGLLGPLLRIGDGVRSWRAIAGGHWLRRANVKE
jgi:hypothetical protein